MQLIDVSSYHIPRAFLKPKNNLLVVFEEHGGKPEDIKILTVKRDNICSFVSESYPAPVSSWTVKNDQLKSTVASGDLKPVARLSCSGKKVIQSVVFASFGNPSGMCGDYTVGNCHAQQAKSVVEKV